MFNKLENPISRCFSVVFHIQLFLNWLATALSEIAWWNLRCHGADRLCLIPFGVFPVIRVVEATDGPGLSCRLVNRIYGKILGNYKITTFKV